MKHNIRFFLDVLPLRDYSWSGIPIVTANIARYLLRNYPQSSVFYYAPDAILPQFVRTAVEHAPGGYLRAFIESGVAVMSSLGNALHGDFVSVGIFPNIKPVHRMFDIELVIMHDISSILLPELHTAASATEHSRAHMRDVSTSDLICCVSEATRQDVLLYLDTPADKVFVSRLGFAPAAVADHREVSPESVPPYVIVLGTIEPRKNLRLIADFIRCRPEICDDFAFMFVGRRGWGTQFEEMFGDLMRMRQCRDRILFTDFVSEETKTRLLQHATFAVYPSLFEGFGLPVLESMAQGCPIIVSRSSSLLEFGLEDSWYFDPLSLEDFSRAFALMHDMTKMAAARRKLAPELQARASAFTWDAFAKRIIDRIEEHLSVSATATSVRHPGETAKRSTRKRQRTAN